MLPLTCLLSMPSPVVDLSIFSTHCSSGGQSGPARPAKVPAAAPGPVAKALELRCQSSSFSSFLNARGTSRTKTHSPPPSFHTPSPCYAGITQRRRWERQQQKRELPHPAPQYPIRQPRQRQRIPPATASCPLWARLQSRGHGCKAYWAVQNKASLQKGAKKTHTNTELPVQRPHCLLMDQDTKCDPGAPFGLGECSRGAVHTNVPRGWAVQNETGRGDGGVCWLVSVERNRFQGFEADPMCSFVMRAALRLRPMVAAAALPLPSGSSSRSSSSSRCLLHHAGCP